MGDLLVECPIHLDAVSINDILVFKCGHGFCEPCLEEHFTHHSQSHLSCPTCRKPVRRREAFPLFLAPAQSSTGTQSAIHPAVEATHTRLTRELKEAKAAHANCPERFIELQHEVDSLRRESAHHQQTIQHLRGRYELLEERLAREADSSARAREESNRTKEEVTKLQVENHKTSKALEQALKEIQVQLERAKQFQGYVEQYKHKCNLEKKKRKAIESANRDLLSRKEDESLMVIDADAPDMLLPDGPDFGWLDEACEVKGDQLSVPGDEDFKFEKESEDDVPLSDPQIEEKQRVSQMTLEGGSSGHSLRCSPCLQDDQAPGPSHQFRSDWHLGVDTLGGSSSGVTRLKRGNGSRQVGGSKIIKVKMSGTRKLARGPLDIDSHGRIKGTVALGSKQRLNSKN